MSNKQKFRYESEYKIDLADWNLPLLEEKLGSIESLVKETVSEVIQCAVDEGAEIYFNLLYEEEFETEEGLLETPDVDRMTIYLPFGDGLETTQWSLDLIEEIENVIMRVEEFNNCDDERVKEAKIKLKVLSDLFKRCSKIIDNAVEKEWELNK